MTTQLMKVVPFEGDILEAIPQGDDIWVSVRRICDALGINNASQQTKLKKKPWATVVNITTVGQDGRKREVFCLHLDSVPMWLAGIETGRANSEVRPKLERYQLKCAKVLKEAFLKPSSTATASDPIELIIQQAQGLIAVATELRNQSHRILQVETTVGKLVETQVAARNDLIELERATEKPLERTTRSKIVELVRAYAHATGVDHREVWNKLYRELQYRYHFDAKTRAKNRNRSLIHIVESEGMLEPLFRLASELLLIPARTEISHALDLQSFGNPDTTEEQPKQSLENS